MQCIQSIRLGLYVLTLASKILKHMIVAFIFHILVLGQGNMPKFVTQLCNPEMSLYILGTPPFSNNPNNNRSLPVGLQHETFLAKTITSV